MNSNVVRSFVFDEEIIKKVHDMFLVDRQTKMYEVAKAVGESYGTAFNILHDKLGMKKRPMSAAIAHGGQQTDAAINFEAVFGAV